MVMVIIRDLTEMAGRCLCFVGLHAWSEWKRAQVEDRDAIHHHEVAPDGTSHPVYRLKWIVQRTCARCPAVDR